MSENLTIKTRSVKMHLGQMRDYLLFHDKKMELDVFKMPFHARKTMKLMTSLCKNDVILNATTLLHSNTR